MSRKQRRSRKRHDDIGHDTTKFRATVTPEGVPLNFALASAGERISAFVLDGVIVILLLVLVWVSALFAATFAGSIVLGPTLIVAFFLRYFYFTGWELLWKGRTPGKRVAGLRVMDRNGGPLTAEAVIVRNMMRELEIFIPLAVMMAPQMFWPGAPWWTRLAAGAWALALVLFPLLNREGLRIGDIVGGTLVVRAPKERLLKDLSVRSARRKVELVFTSAQLDMYGIYELEVLENLLRRHSVPVKTLVLVATKIRAKIGWEGKVHPRWFLEEFYRAQRGRLEHKLLFGQRRERKREGRLGDGGGSGLAGRED